MSFLDWLGVGIALGLAWLIYEIRSARDYWAEHGPVEDEE